MLSLDSVLCVGLLLCKGTIEEKANVLFDLLNKKEDFLEHNVLIRNGTQFEPIIRTILEYAIIYSELFKNRVPRNSEKFTLTQNSVVKNRAIQTMRLSMSDNRDQMGIIWALFKNNHQLTRSEFIERFQDPNCSWIVNEQLIRLRMWKSFSTLQILDKIDSNAGNQ